MKMRKVANVAMRTIVVILMIAVLTVSMAGLTWGQFAKAPDAPVERLIKNITAYTTEHPDDAHGYYVLGRVHYLAFVLKRSSLGAFEKDASTKLPILEDDNPILFKYKREDFSSGKKPSFSEEQMIGHIKGAIENFRKAISKNDKKGLYHLGLGCILEEGAAIADKIGLIPGEMSETKKNSAEDESKATEKFKDLIKQLGDKEVQVRDRASKELQRQIADAMPVLKQFTNDADEEVKNRVKKLIEDHWLEQAIASYFEAYKLEIEKDLAIEKQDAMYGLMKLIGYEAGKSYLRIARNETLTEKEQIAKVKKDIETVESKPRPVLAKTPIIFSFNSPVGLDDLLSPQTTVKFDLDGTGCDQTWPWVKPDTAILVWDPKGTGKITSGWQLFGSVSFFMFWENGYRVLDALDDNRDGKLEGDELCGLALWFDRDSNGISDTGEVVPVARTGIKSISARSTSKIGDSPCNSAGLIMSDGRVLPTYDWVTSPVK